MRRIFLLALVVVLAFASGALADKVVTYSTLVVGDVSSVCFARDASPQGWKATAAGFVRATGGGYGAQISGPVTSGQKTAIENYISTHVLTPFNAQEGLQ